MMAIYGDDLFERLRPDWAGVLVAQVEAWANDAEQLVWIADLDGVTVGFIVTTCDLQTGMGMVELVAVDQAHQRQGVGGRLVAHALAHLREVGVVYVEAYIRDFPGHEPAHQMFRSQGFARRAVTPVLLYRTIEWSGHPAPPSPQIRRITSADVDPCVA